MTIPLRLLCACFPSLANMPECCFRAWIFPKRLYWHGNLGQWRCILIDLFRYRNRVTIQTSRWPYCLFVQKFTCQFSIPRTNHMKKKRSAYSCESFRHCPQSNLCEILPNDNVHCKSIKGLGCCCCCCHGRFTAVCSLLGAQQTPRLRQDTTATYLV